MTGVQTCALPISAIPELLKRVDLRGAIITMDAMGTQKAIAKAIVDGGADYVLALKGNQETLHDAVIAYVNEQMQTDFANIGARRHLTKEKGHGREEIRHLRANAGAENSAGVRSLEGPADDRRGDVVVRSRREGDGRNSRLHQQPADGGAALRPRGSPTRFAAIAGSRTPAIGASTSPTAKTNLASETCTCARTSPG